MRWQNIEEYSLSGYKTLLNSKWNLPKDLTNFLLHNHFERIGLGKSSEVYKHPEDNMVLKVNAIKFDPAFVEFVQFCTVNRSNKHLPRVGKIRNYTSDTGQNFFTVLLEKLDPIDFDLADDVGTIIGEWLHGTSEDRQKGITTPIYTRAQNDIDNFWVEEKKVFRLSDDVVTQLQAIGPLLLKIKSNSKLIGIGLDLHPDNLMQRGTTIVLSDPIAVT
jgi:hypothetical protein